MRVNFFVFAALLSVGMFIAHNAAAVEPTAEQLELLKTFREEFVQLTPGQGEFPAEFTMGAADGAKTEQPAHQVKIARPFAIARYEVPQNLWQAVMGENPSKWKGKRNSVEMLSYDDAEKFCAAATELMRTARLIKATETIRLPSEAEWEYATRAGTKTRYSFGDDVSDLDEHAWHANYEGAPADGSVWKKDGDEKQRVLRSGSWKDKAERLTSTARRAGAVDLKDDAVGLRCVLSD